MNNGSKFHMLAAAVGIMASASPVSLNTERRKSKYQPKDGGLGQSVVGQKDAVRMRNAEEKRERKAYKRARQANEQQAQRWSQDYLDHALDSVEAQEYYQS